MMMMMMASVMMMMMMMKMSVRTYVNYVKNICYLELANPFTKCTLLGIG